jgi:hypothetical protein
MVQGFSIGEIIRQLNEQRIPARSRASEWERSTVWAMLRNLAHRISPASPTRRDAGAGRRPIARPELSVGLRAR